MNTEDQKAFQQHVDFGLNMLAQFPGLPDDVLSIIRNHHERVDGSGYPARRRGDQLSLLSRIHAVVDEYESLVNTPDPLTTMTPQKLCPNCTLTPKQNSQKRSSLDLFKH